MNPVISVIVPVYGVAGFIEKCTRSLMEQTLKENIEFIFVDDCTEDDSIVIIKRVLNDYPLRKSQTRICHHPENKGLPSARNTGLHVATGEYILHFDGDDFAEPLMLENFLKVVETTHADYIWSNWLLTYDSKDRFMREPTYATPEEAIVGILKGQMKYNVWNKIIRKSIYVDNNISFPDGFAMGEDMTMIRLLACSKSVAHMNYAGYHYVRYNTQSMTSNIDKKHLSEIIHNVNETVEFLRLRKMDDIDTLSDTFCLHTKFPFIVSSASTDYEKWNLLWPHSNKSISAAGFSFRNKLLNVFAANNMWWLLKLHFKIYKYIYEMWYC